MQWHVRIVVPLITTVFAVAVCVLSVALIVAGAQSNSKTIHTDELSSRVAVFRHLASTRLQTVMNGARVTAGFVHRGHVAIPAYVSIGTPFTPEGLTWGNVLRSSTAPQVFAAMSIAYESGDQLAYVNSQGLVSEGFLFSNGSSPFPFFSPWIAQTSTFAPPIEINDTLYSRFLLEFNTKEAVSAVVQRGQQLSQGTWSFSPHWTSLTLLSNGEVLLGSLSPLVEPSGMSKAALSTVYGIETLFPRWWWDSVEYFLVYNSTVIKASDPLIDVTRNFTGSQVPVSCEPLVTLGKQRCFLKPQFIESDVLRSLEADYPGFVAGSGPDEVHVRSFVARRITLEFFEGKPIQGSTMYPFTAIVVVRIPEVSRTALFTYSNQEYDPAGYVAYAAIAAIFSVLLVGNATVLGLRPAQRLPRRLHAAARMQEGGLVKNISRFTEIASLQLSYNAAKHKLDEMVRFLPHYILVRLAADVNSGMRSGDDADSLEVSFQNGNIQTAAGDLEFSAIGNRSGRVAVVPTNDDNAGQPVVPLDVILNETEEAFTDCRCTVMYLLLDDPIEEENPLSETDSTVHTPRHDQTPPSLRSPTDSSAAHAMPGASEERLHFLSSAVAEVTRHGGVVDQLTGRSLTATFNCHTAVARHQEQASLAAINIHRFAVASTAANCPYAVMLDADHAASVTVGTGGARSRLVISRALSVVKKVAPLLLAHGCRVGATERVTSVVPLQHVPLDCVRLTLDFASTGIPSSLEKAERVCELIDSEKTDDFDVSIMFINTAFDEMRVGKYDSAIKQWEYARKKLSGAQISPVYTEERFAQYIEFCTEMTNRMSGRQLMNVERAPFRTFRSEERPLDEALSSWLRGNASGSSSVHGGSGHGPLIGGISATSTVMGGSYTGAADPPMFGGSVDMMFGESSASMTNVNENVFPEPVAHIRLPDVPHMD